MKNMNKKQTLHYGWVMLAFTVFSAFVYVGLCSNTVSLYVQPVSDANGFPRGLFTIKNSIASIIMGVASLFYGKISAKFSLKKILSAGCISIIVCYVIQMFAKTLPAFYLSALFQGFGFGLCSSTALTLMINRWFSARFGFLTGLVYTATSVGGAIFFPLIGRMISASSYVSGLLFSAVLVAVYLVLLLIIFVDFPHDKGLMPIYSETGAESSGRVEDEPGLSFAEIRKSPLFLPSILLIFLLTIAATAVQGTMTARLVDVGFTLAFATSIVSILYVFTSIAKIPAGLLADKYGMLPVTVISSIAAIIALVFLITVRTPLMAYLMTPFMGVTMVLCVVPAPLIGPTLFGRKALAQYSGLYIGAMSLGTAVGQTLFNFMYDASGSYVSSYIVCIVLIVVSVCGLGVVLKKNGRNWLLENEARKNEANKK